MNWLRSKLLGTLVGFGALIGVANAEQVVVYEGPADSSQTISADFAVNRQLGRAWVDVQVQTIQIGSEPVFVAPTERQVAGLYYDPEQKQVLYRTATGPVVCAEDAGAQLNPTGNCQLTPSTEQRTLDDGFHRREQQVARIVLDVRSAVALQRAAVPQE
jgi:hypothetical protein